ncbi:glycoside hydrolase family 3 protein [Cellulomonas sp. URHD0024]|uniref:beta-glucosidase n=1 Tax=Cellulomonas sp. URHD0024 TaxID=1302620 RepID=UPI0004096DC5|nr:glycoside hydrolase family 3 N-terminal domain-containing protein [Cellulomonas sp. URHD0024]
MHLHHHVARRATVVVTAAALSLVGAGVAHAATTDPNPSQQELDHAALSREAAGEGMVLLDNKGGALPMARTGNVAVFGVGAYKTVKGGTGSGDVNNRYTITVRQGLEGAGYAVTTSSAYWDAMTAAYDAKYANGGGNPFGPPIDYSSVEQPLTPASVQPTAPTDTAIFVVARNSGEGTDRSSGQGDFLLRDVERADIQLIGQTYKHVVVVLNVGGVVDTSFYAQINGSTADPTGKAPLDSLLLMSQPGQEAGNALVDVLKGTVTPSGKLTDTWASQYSYYPASATFANADGNPLREQYSEGIYVGYRYFDSFYRSIDPAHPAGVVTYPFGYGGSYTTFRIETEKVRADAEHVTVKARVTNTGRKASGKEVVQVYFSAPTTGLDTPYQELAGSAKTDTLAPGASQRVTITFRTSEMSSFDKARSAYVLDAGDYLVRVGDSSRSTKVAARLSLPRTVTTTLVRHEQDDVAPAQELTGDPATFYSYPTQAREIAHAQRIGLDPRRFRVDDERSEYQQNVTVPPGSPYAPFDGTTISSTTAYLDRSQTNWEGTGTAYQPRPGETVKYVRTNPATTLYDVKRGRASLEQLVAGLNVSQLADIVEGSSAAGSTLTAVGAAGYTTPKYENLGIPGMTLSDGPAGLRLTQQITTQTPTEYQWATAWPIGTMLAQTWNPDLQQRVGAAIGAEMATYGVTLWLAPGMNLHRDPLNGRNFEYFSEDPLVTGLTAASETKGVQSVPGVGVTIKHFVANNQETQRNATDSVIGERALRELYLKGFEIAVKSAQPMAVMTSYNQVNDHYTAASYDLVTNVLRGEWGFKGLVMTDWTSVNQATPLGTQYAGNDLIEPGNNPGEIINTIKKVTPTVDLNGMPAYTKNLLHFGTFTFTSWQWQLGGFGLSATGDQTVATRVDSTTDLSQVPLSGVSDGGVFTPVAPYGTVQAAYDAVNALLAPANTALTPAQKAGITVTDVVHADPADATSPVVAYTVTLRGSYPTVYPMRLGDLQRSAIHILNVVSQSAPFAELAADQGVHGIKVGPYTAQFRHLVEYVEVDHGHVWKPGRHH